MEYTKGNWYYEGETGLILCIEEGKDSPTEVAEVLETQANAQLISAAPRNYETLKTISALATSKKYIDFSGAKQVLKDIADIAEMAIRATGGRDDT